MSGHSKWSTIKRKKGAQDAKRGAVFTRIIKEITVAARIGGGDPDSNPRLRVAIAQAKAANMPNINVERGIKKGTGDLAGVAYESLSYEGYGPGGAAIMLDVLTDNKNRSVADIRHIITKYGGNLGESGSVAWQFENRGTITVLTNGTTEDELFDVAIDFGAEEIETEDNKYVITVPYDKAFELEAELLRNSIPVDSVELGLEPTTSVAVSGNDAVMIMKMLEALEEHDDVEKVYSNFDISEDDLALES